MGRSSQGHNREIHGVDSANQVGMAIPTTGGGYGGGGLEPGTPPFYPPASTVYGGGSGGAGIRSGRRLNQWRILGRWQPGTVVRGLFTVTDPDDETNEYEMEVTIPEGAPDGGWPAKTAAQVVCQAIDALTHIRCEIDIDGDGTLFDIEPSSPDNTVSSALWID